MNRLKISKVSLCLMMGFTSLQGCLIPARLPIVPQAMAEKAEVSDMPGIRYLVGGDMTQFMHDAKESIQMELTYRAAHGQTGPLPPANILANSGAGLCAVGLPAASAPSSNW
ncbi:MAG: hypothetical protein ACXWTP_11760 [Methylosarcina sp.]